MSWWHNLRYQVSSLFHRRVVDNELDEEPRFRLEFRAERLDPSRALRYE